MELKPLTWAQRHLDAELPKGRLKGFNPQPNDWMAVRYVKPANLTSFEYNRLVRSSLQESSSGLPLLEYRLWLEAGKYHPADANKPDSNYNSNTWRNFCQNFGIDTRQTEASNTGERRVQSTVAAIYPLNIPKPSKMGNKSYSEYVASSKTTFKSPQRRMIASNRIFEDEQAMKKLRLESELRNPPLDKQGLILPPEGYKRYSALFLPPTHCEDPPPLEVTADMEPDLFGQLVRRRPRANLWKLSYRTNNPQYRQAMQFASEIKAGEKDTSMFPTHF